MRNIFNLKRKDLRNDKERPAPKNRLNADDRRRPSRGLDIISKVPYSRAGIRIKTLQTYHISSSNIMCDSGLFKVEMNTLSRDALAAGGILRDIHPLRLQSLPSLSRLLSTHPSGPHSPANVSVLTYNVWKTTRKLRRTINFQPATFLKHKETCLAPTGRQNTTGYKSQLSYL